MKTMQHERKSFVYLQRLNHTNTAAVAACNVERYGLFFCPWPCRYTAAYQPRKASIMGVLTAVCRFRQREVARRFFRAILSKSNTQMRNKFKTAGETAQSITFKADWLDFTEHLSNAQVGRLLRCVARFERGDIDTRHVAELRKDAAVGVAYNFITEQLERRRL